MSAHTRVLKSRWQQLQWQGPHSAVNALLGMLKPLPALARAGLVTFRDATRTSVMIEPCCLALLVLAGLLVLRRLAPSGQLGDVQAAAGKCSGLATLALGVLWLQWVAAAARCELDLTAAYATCDGALMEGQGHAGRLEQWLAPALHAADGTVPDTTVVQVLMKFSEEHAAALMMSRGGAAHAHVTHAVDVPSGGAVAMDATASGSEICLELVPDNEPPGMLLSEYSLRRIPGASKGAGLSVVVPFRAHNCSPAHLLDKLAAAAAASNPANLLGVMGQVEAKCRAILVSSEVSQVRRL